MDFALEKTLFLTTFITNWPRGSPQKVIRRAKWDQRVASLSVALGLTLNWWCPLGIRHWQSCSFGFFRSSYASPKSKRQRAFLDFGDRYAHQIFGTNVNFSGSYENATTFWLGFRNRWPDPSSETVRFCGKLIKFSAFFHFSQHWMGVFTCGFHHYTLFFIEKQEMRAHRLLANKNTECPGGFNCVLRHSWNRLKINVFQLFSALKRNFCMRFSPLCVIFIVKTENESSEALS